MNKELPNLAQAKDCVSLKGRVKIGTIEITLTQLEADWMDVIPFQFHIQAWHALSDFRKTMKWNNAIERHKTQLAFMDGFVQAITLALRGENDGNQAEEKEAQLQIGIPAQETNEANDGVPPSA